jgi:hypothetical protein
MVRGAVVGVGVGVGRLGQSRGAPTRRKNRNRPNRHGRAGSVPQARTHVRNELGKAATATAEATRSRRAGHDGPRVMDCRVMMGA